MLAQCFCVKSRFAAATWDNLSPQWGWTSAVLYGQILVFGTSDAPLAEVDHLSWPCTKYFINNPEDLKDTNNRHSNTCLRQVKQMKTFFFLSFYPLWPGKCSCSQNVTSHWLSSLSLLSAHHQLYLVNTETEIISGIRTKYFWIS